MSESVPYVNSTGALKTMLEKIKVAQTPSTFSHDFLKTELGISERAMVSLLKRIGFLEPSGKPTQLYKDFRNDNKSKQAMAKAIKHGYQLLYKRNEYAHSLNDGDLRDLIAEVTGNDHDSKVVKTMRTTYKVLKSYASFKQENETPVVDKEETAQTETQNHFPQAQDFQRGENIGLNLGYTINLNLPETTDIEVFNAIFKSLNENLLQK